MTQSYQWRPGSWTTTWVFHVAGHQMPVLGDHGTELKRHRSVSCKPVANTLPSRGQKQRTILQIQRESIRSFLANEIRKTRSYFGQSALGLPKPCTQNESTTLSLRKIFCTFKSVVFNLFCTATHYSNPL